MKTKFYNFNQNNSGGSFYIDSDLHECVIIEAENAIKANEKAESIGIYFNGCENGSDCECCGDRWYSVDESDGSETPLYYGRDLFNCEPIIKSYSNKEFAIIHYLNGEKKKVNYAQSKA